MAVFVDEVTRVAAGHADREGSSMQHRAGVSSRQASHSLIVESFGVGVALNEALSCLA